MKDSTNTATLTQTKHRTWQFTITVKLPTTLLSQRRLSDREDRWFVRGVWEAIWEQVEQPALNKKLPALARMGWGNQRSSPPLTMWPIRGLMKSGVSRHNVAKWVAFPAWTQIAHAYWLSHGESHGNDNVRRSRWIRRYNNSPSYVTSNMAAAP